MPPIPVHPAADFFTAFFPALRDFEGHRPDPYFDNAAKLVNFQ